MKLCTICFKAKFVVPNETRLICVRSDYTGSVSGRWRRVNASRDSESSSIERNAHGEFFGVSAVSDPVLYTAIDSDIASSIPRTGEQWGVVVSQIGVPRAVNVVRHDADKVNKSAHLRHIVTGIDLLRITRNGRRKYQPFFYR